MKNYYHILGVSKTATTEEIKTAFRKLSKKLHPDVNAGDPFFAARFLDLQQAYDVLVDDQKRKTYDQKLSNFYNKGIDNDLYEALRRRKEERKKAEEQRRREEEERMAEEERLRLEAEQRWQQEVYARRKARKRLRAVALILFTAVVTVVTGLFINRYLLSPATEYGAQSEMVPSASLDTVQAPKADTVAVPPATLVKDRHLRKLDGRWKGTIYRFSTKEDLPVELRVHASAGRFSVSYPSKKCLGKWEIVKIDSLAFHFQESITRGADSCTQDGRIVLNQFKAGQYQFSYYWPNDKTLNASGILFRR